MEITPDSIEFSAPFTTRSTRFMTLENKSPTTLAFKIKTTAPNTYSVRPNCSIIYPGECQSVAVHHQGFTEEPDHDYECKDKFMVLWAPVLNLSKLEELDNKEGDTSNAPKTISASPSDNSISSNRSSASSTLLAMIDDISGYWRRLEEESYDVINKKKIKVLAHVFSKTHDGVQLSSASSAATVKEAGVLSPNTNLSRRKTKRETLKDVKESLKEVKSTTPMMDNNGNGTTPQMTPFIAPPSASFQTQFPPRSISHPQLSAFTSPYAGVSGSSPRPEDQLLEVNQRLAILMAELDELKRKPQEGNETASRNVTTQIHPQSLNQPQATTHPTANSQLQTNVLASLNNPSVGILAFLCFALVLFSLNASKMGVLIGLAQTSLMAAIVYFVAQNQLQKA
ncbi:hypothetical protein B0I72DRAFT_133185 [Yarrowia lipolytica]|uniref:YALI0D05181p n=2 Tax=Yarrowia lipolytica TaxID=4952 RepID=Q6CA78_YARLI|nr:YALI0D05181p [Yarrowia lipolytica CLIB122]AOW03610.1 hypothetical protein YALI1_D06736g [Yarrowia lipolytica]KAB8284628.1 hypothetical protein BKA91DRAFT_134594 [Yarrowia lipolytica]KAE8170503.1 hypothetical protein BKA90DRAFT_140732 [Yarrowia lipolytica]KAJ8054772.1 hypothetical protein LXG23DRAFT_20175 [Yarrowia lipolytica]QNP98580.1 Vesicle-associated membrane protein-associated protein SCS2 [Yarrowia lipolytica]|eukprot:XP_502434.2 YALI0D05181p [Yarrowia lipolytica CLIB122]